MLPEMLTRDLDNAPPLPEAQLRQTSLQKVNSLIFWFVYFLLIWQATCHLSDNGLAWLLRFLVSWLKVLGIEISNDVLEKLILSFPGSLYLVRQFLNLDRDNFNKLWYARSARSYTNTTLVLRQSTIDKWQKSVPTPTILEDGKWFVMPQ